jgi:hypothetical protein
VNAAADRADKRVQAENVKWDFRPTDHIVDFGGQQNFKDGFYQGISFSLAMYRLSWMTYPAGIPFGAVSSIFNNGSARRHLFFGHCVYYAWYRKRVKVCWVIRSITENKPGWLYSVPEAGPAQPKTPRGQIQNLALLRVKMGR